MEVQSSDRNRQSLGAYQSNPNPNNPNNPDNPDNPDNNPDKPNMISCCFHALIHINSLDY